MNAWKTVAGLKRPIRFLRALPERLLFYKTYDSSAYWRARAADPGQAAVLWRNQEYNELYRRFQREIVARYVKDLPARSHVLDIGCGIGVVSRMIIELNPEIRIDAVDFPEMLAAGEDTLSDPRITPIASSAEEYMPCEGVYDLIVSSGCYSAIRDIAKLECSIDHGARMLKHGGRMLMIDPFHRWNYLARAKYASRDVNRFLDKRELVLEHKSGVLFWPFREWLANSATTGESLRRRFLLGERIARVLGAHLWSDYKVLVFRKRP